MIANAGILRDRSFLKMEAADIEAVISVHLLSAFWVGQPAFAAMEGKERSRRPHGLPTTSGSGLFGNFGQANYGAAKMGLVGLTRTLAIEGAKLNIKVNAVAPMAGTRLVTGGAEVADDNNPMAPRLQCRAHGGLLLAHRDLPQHRRGLQQFRRLVRAGDLWPQRRLGGAVEAKTRPKGSPPIGKRSGLRRTPPSPPASWPPRPPFRKNSSSSSDKTKEQTRRG